MQFIETARQLELYILQHAKAFEKKHGDKMEYIYECKLWASLVKYSISLLNNVATANKIMRKRLRKYKEYISDGIATFELPLQAIHTWKANQKKCNAYHTIKSMMSYFYDLFGDEYEQAAY